MNIRFYNAKILTLNEQEQFEIIRGELWVMEIPSVMWERAKNRRKSVPN